MSLTDNQRRILRLVLAITTGFTVAQLIDWPLSYMMPILLAMLMTGPGLDFKAGIQFFVVIVVGCLVGLLLSMTILNYPLVCLPVLFLLLLHINIAAKRGTPPFVIMMLLMGVMIIPLIGIPSVMLSWLLVKALITSALAAVAIALVFFTLLPTPPRPVPPAPQAGALLTPEQSGLISTLVIMPLVTFFYLFSATNAVVVLVFSAILAQTANLASVSRGASALVLANALGGVFAIISYNLLATVPMWPFMSALIALVTTFFAGHIFSGKPVAQLYSTAFTAVLLLVGSSIVSDNKDATDAFFNRLIQVGLAGIYVVTAFTLLKKLSVYLGWTPTQPARTADITA